MINELFRKMTVAQIFSALSGTVCMLIDSIIIGRLLGVESMSAYGLALPILTLAVAAFSAICTLANIAYTVGLGAGNCV